MGLHTWGVLHEHEQAPCEVDPGSLSASYLYGLAPSEHAEVSA